MEKKAADYMSVVDDELASEGLMNIRMMADLFINADKSGVVLKSMTLVTMGKFLLEAADAIAHATGIEA